jgi:2-keto-4-pentenoate hydratase/2-oxohepta-3-ene-1,7-dioic acid hydratase in catechol pathway
MRLCRFEDGKYGAVRGASVHDVTLVVERIVARAAGAVRGDPVIARLDEIKAAATDLEKYKAHPLSEVTLLSPVAHPSKLVAAPTNYRAHIAEMSADKTVSNPHPPASRCAFPSGATTTRPSSASSSAAPAATSRKRAPSITWRATRWAST